MAWSEDPISGSAWVPPAEAPDPADEGVDSQRLQVPTNFGPSGFFVRNDGKQSRIARDTGLEYQSMAKGVVDSRCARWRVHEQIDFDVEDLITEVPAKYLELHDQYDHSQGDPYPWEAVFRAHVLRLVKGWKHETALHTYLKKKPFLTADLGFESIPDQSTLWRAWEHRFTDDIRDAIVDTAEVVVEAARSFDAPAPDPNFLPGDLDESDDDTVEMVAREKAQQVWQQAKPFVTDCFELQRADNASIPEGAWWEQHAYMGMREDMYANDAPGNFKSDSTREKSPSGDSHRYQLKKLSVADVRRMLQETTQRMIERARLKKELTHGEIMAAIDITKGYPWTGQVKRNSEGELKEPWVMGYKGDDLYFQWAVIKIVGDDVPFILDAVPVVRGRDRADIVDDLLGSALSMLPNLSLVMMDREFDNDSVKTVCEDHGVSYLNPARVFTHDEHATHIKEMEANGETFDVTEQQRIDGGQSRKCIYLPKREYEDSESDDSPTEQTASSNENPVRQEMLDEWVLEEDDLESERSEKETFSSLLTDIEEDEDLPERETFDAPIIPFETNHPLVETEVADKREMAHQIGRMMSKYKRRWGIENGFKKVKKFLCRTTSKDHQYRYFNFAFACVLYNCWRIVDLLVQLAIKDDPTYSPEITANLFLTIAKKYYGLDPPD